LVSYSNNPFRRHRWHHGVDSPVLLAADLGIARWRDGSRCM